MAPFKPGTYQMSFRGTLHEDRKRVILVIYICILEAGNPSYSVTHFGMLATRDGRGFSVVDHDNCMDPGPNIEVIKVKGKGLATIDNKMRAIVTSQEISNFRDLDYMRKWYYREANRSVKSQIDRGLHKFVKR